MAEKQNYVVTMFVTSTYKIEAESNADAVKQLEDATEAQKSKMLQRSDVKVSAQRE